MLNCAAGEVPPDTAHGAYGEITLLKRSELEYKGLEGSNCSDVLPLVHKLLLGQHVCVDISIKILSNLLKLYWMEYRETFNIQPVKTVKYP